MAETNTDPVEYGQPKDGITADTPKNILLDAGTIHKGLTYTAGQSGAAGSWNFSESLWFATGDGNTFKAEPEITDLEVDGAWVSVEGLQIKTGETVTLEVSPVEIKPDVLKATLIAEDGTSDATGYDLLQSKERIETGDYIDNLAYVGTKTNGEPIIIILPRALCTSGLELAGANKEAAKPTVTFKAVAPLSGSHRTIPYKIYTPTPAEG